MERQCRTSGQVFYPDDRLKEFNFGIFDGLTADEAIALDKKMWDRWMDDYNHVTLPEGENYTDYHNRMSAFLAEHARPTRIKMCSSSPTVARCTVCWLICWICRFSQNGILISSSAALLWWTAQRVLACWRHFTHQIMTVLN